MMLNNGWHARGRQAWDGTAASQVEITNWNNVSIQFNVPGGTDLAANAVFDLYSYAPQSGNPCLPDLATEAAILDTITCVGIPFSGAVGSAMRITIPAGTKAGSDVWVALACRPNKFIGIKAVSGNAGNANVRATYVLTGPHT